MQVGILYTPQFKRDYKKLSKNLRQLLKLRGQLFEQNPFRSILHTHKLGGKLKGYWAFSVDHRNRVIFEFLGNDEVLFLRVGDHSIYKK